MTEYLFRDYRAVATGKIFIGQTPAFGSVFSGILSEYPEQKIVPPRMSVSFPGQLKGTARVMSEEGLRVGMGEGTATNGEAGSGYRSRQSDE